MKLSQPTQRSTGPTNLRRRSGVVNHPSEWPFGGYNEIWRPKQSCSIINRHAFMNILGIRVDSKLRAYYEQRIESSIKNQSNSRESKWTESIAVGSKQFVETTKTQLGVKTERRKVSEKNGIFCLKERQNPYSAVYDPEKVGIYKP